MEINRYKKGFKRLLRMNDHQFDISYIKVL